MSDLQPSDATATVGDQVDVSATITNDGDAAASQDVTLSIGGNDVHTESIELDAGASTTFSVGVDTTDFDAGEYSHTVATADDSASGTLTLEDGGSGVDALQAYYPLDGDSPTDASGNGNDAQIVGDPDTSASGQIDGGYALDGDGDYLDLPAFEGSGSVSMSMWVNIDGWSGNSEFAIWGSDLSNGPSMEFVADDSGAPGLYYWDKTDTVDPDTDSWGEFPGAGSPIPTGEWVHLAAVYDADAGTFTVYQNGQEDFSTTDEIGGEYTISGEASQVGALNPPDQARFVNGTIDDVRFHDRALSAAEIGEMAANTQASAPWQEHLVAGSELAHQPRLAYGQVPGTIADGKLILELGDTARVTLYVEDNTLSDGIWMHMDGEPVSNDPIRWIIEVQDGELVGRIRSESSSWGFHFNATISEDGSPSGSYEKYEAYEPWSGGGESNKTQVESGDVTGTHVSWEQARQQSDPIVGEQWPRWTGPRRDFTSSLQGHSLVNALSEMEPLWRSEADLPSGIGNISRSGKGIDNKDDPVAGGAAQPVLANGRIYAFTFEPVENGTVLNDPDSDTPMNERLREDGTGENGENSVYENFTQAWGDRIGNDVYDNELKRWTAEANDVVTAIDARTGETLWQTTVPGGANWQDHKGGFNNHTPVYHEGRLYVLGSMRQVFCVDAEDGKLLWKTGPDSSLQGPFIQQRQTRESLAPFFANSRASHTTPFVVDDTLIVPGRAGRIEARDPDTGALLWTKSGVDDQRVPSVWNHEDTAYLLTFSSDRKDLLCLTLQGETVWTLEDPVKGTFRNHGPGINGDRFAAAVLGGEGDDRQYTVLIGTLSPDGATVEHEFTRTGSWLAIQNRMRPIIRNGRVITSLYGSNNENGRTFMIDANTGNAIKTLEGTHTQQNGHVQLHEDRLLVLGDNHHGDNNMRLTGATPETFEEAPDYTPPHATTSPYSKAPWIQAYGDGRLFIRGADGIYAYDMRDSEATQGNLTPQARIEAEPAEGEAPLTVELDGSDSADPDGDALDFHWELGDGRTATDATVSRTFSEPGTYPVRLTVEDASGLSSSTETEVLVRDPDSNEPPVIEVETSQLYGELPHEVTFDASASVDPEGQELSYEWTLPDGSTKEGPNITHRFEQNGELTVRLTVTDEPGATASKPVMVWVETPSIPETVAWEEPFDGSEVANLPGDVQGDAELEDGKLTVSGGEVIWTSPSIDIGGMQQPLITARFTGDGGLEESDLAELAYSVDGGDFVVVDTFTGAFPVAAPITTVPTADELVIRARMKNSSSYEKHLLHEVKVWDHQTSGE